MRGGRGDERGVGGLEEGGKEETGGGVKGGVGACAGSSKGSYYM